MQIVIFPIFAVSIFVSVVFLKLSVGLPVRTLLIGLVFLLIVIFYKRHFSFFIFRHVKIVALFLFMGILGAALTLSAGASVGETFIFLLKQIIQPFMLLTCTYVMCSLVGVRSTAAVLLAVTAIASAFAIAQYLGVDAAWRIRDIIGGIQGDPPHTRNFILTKSRAMGLAFSPIELSYLITSCYIVALILLKTRILDIRTYYIILGGIGVAALSNETRSLLLGLMVSEVIRYLSNYSIRRYLLFMAVVLIGYAGFLSLQEVLGGRVTSVEDQSAAGRKVLYSFGIRLFFDNSYGLGWSFAARDYAWLYWEHLTEFGKPQIVYRLELHNAILNFSLVYGIGGFVPLLVLLFVRPKLLLMFGLYFSSYVVHSFLHNKGIFYSGLFVWYPIAIFLYERDVGRLKFGRTVKHEEVKTVPPMFAPSGGYAARA